MTEKENNPFWGGNEIYDIPGSKFTMELSTVADSADVFDEDTDVTAVELPGKLKQYSYIPWGTDNELPFHIMDMVGSDEVMSQNKHFNVLTCYGSGLVYRDVDTEKKTKDKDISLFITRNAYPKFFLEQSTDMKYFFFCIAVLILDKEGKQIVKVRHKDACYCRFQKANKQGKIEHVFYANWRKSITDENVEVITLLDEYDPWGELEWLMGREPGPDGLTHVRTKERKFAVLCKFPTPGCRYYPFPYYAALFRGDWYDIKKLIAKGKKYKIKNHASVKYQVEVHKDYWNNICRDESITEPLEKLKRIKQEKENIKNFVSGIENSGKVWITGYYVDPNGTEVRMVRITIIDPSKEGGDWSEDIQEASNMTCYADNIHPNMVGAVPGKSQSNNSGSDKRELFTLKQSIETPYHDIMAPPHTVIIGYNGWYEKVYPDVPMITLTTLDENTDAKKKKINDNKEPESV